MSEIRIPAAYIVSAQLPLEQVGAVLRVLSFTPVYAVLIHDLYDYELARHFDEQVIRTSNEDESIKWALYSFQETRIPSLVIGTASSLDAIYENGAREAVNG